MKKRLRMLVLLTGLALPVGFAQQIYVGASGSPTPTDDTLELGAQLGLNFFPSFGVRAAIAGDPSSGAELGSLDALYSFYLPMSPNAIYLGAGADVFNLSQLSSVESLQDGVFGAHAVGGVEFRLGRFGLFGKVQPGYLVGESFSSEDAYYVRARGSVNFHF